MIDVRREQQRWALITAYAARSGLTIHEFFALGLTAIPCTCDWERCTGWQVVSLCQVRHEVALGHTAIASVEREEEDRI